MANTLFNFSITVGGDEITKISHYNHDVRNQMAKQAIQHFHGNMDIITGEVIFRYWKS